MMQITKSLKTCLKWKDVPRFTDEYFYPTVQVQESGTDLHFKFSALPKSKIRKTFYMTIENYRQYTALDIINELEQIGFATRHSYDAVMKFYNDRDLDLGFTQKTLKPWKQTLKL